MSSWLQLENITRSVKNTARSVEKLAEEGDCVEHYGEKSMEAVAEASRSVRIALSHLRLAEDLLFEALQDDNDPGDF